MFLELLHDMDQQHVLQNQNMLLICIWSENLHSIQPDLCYGFYSLGNGIGTQYFCSKYALYEYFINHILQIF